MAGPLEALGCPREIFCSVVAGNAPRCGSPETVPPGLLAEELCPQALASAIRQERDTGSTDPDQSAHYYRLGSLFLDLSLARGVEASGRFAGAAFEYLSDAASGHTEDAASAALLIAYREGFALRRGTDVASSPRERISSNLCALTASHHMTSSRIQARIGTHLLYKPFRGTFPTTAREAGRLYGASPDAPPNDADTPYLYTRSKTGKVNHVRGGAPKIFTQRGKIVWDFNREALHALNVELGVQDSTPPASPETAGRLVLGWLCEAGSLTGRSDHARKTVNLMQRRLRREGLVATNNLERLR